MLQSIENETEILLGNKQLLGIFFVVALLLGVAFGGGYMLGRGPKKPANADPALAGASSSSTTAQTPTDTAASGGETHSVIPAEDPASASTPPVPEAAPLGTPKAKTVAKAQPPIQPVSAPAAETASKENFAPAGGQQYLQVAAVAKDHANTVAAVLRQKGFSAHAVPKPGDPALYRVIVGPLRDAGDLASTRDSLRKTGFTNVIVQRYQ